MIPEHLPSGADSPSDPILESLEDLTVASDQCRLHRCARIELWEDLLKQKDELIQHQDVLRKEADHRLLNDLQMVVSVLLLQSRSTTNAEAATQLSGAAERVAMIERVHRRLHYLDSVRSVAFKKYIEELCRDFATMLSSEERPEQFTVVEAIEINLLSEIAVPIGFIVSELIMNAAKYGNGHTLVKLEPHSQKGYALSVTNDGQDLPEGFDPAASRGLGMRIIEAFVKQIGGELRCGRGEANHGARFTVLFSDRT